MTFADKEYLWLLLLLLPLLGWYFWKHQKQHAHIEVPNTIAFGDFRKTRKVWQHILYTLLFSSLVFLIVAMARPQTSFSFEKSKTEGIDIVIALDISFSMLAQDFQPNRLEAAKDVAMEFVTNRPNDRIGLVVFSGESYTQCPPTTDQRILLNLFSEVKTNDAIDGGTAIGNGLATSINRLRESEAKSKVIILLTDGENNRGSIAPETAAELAGKFGVKVYTIGIGSNGTARTPVGIRPNGHILYDNLPVKLDEALLQTIAETTDGKYYRATTKNKLKEIYTAIDKLEKTKILKDKHTRHNEMFQLFAFIGLALLALYILLKFWILKITP
ncbi:vWA domain-containing protein [Balneicella halophila]|uniref:vWA domain-containing protein n=1 Tax=Balneicella halophila TaxID=1537566 RepID=UPI001A9C99E3|nr:VWA domain-containing protein [Balneicella halophila]